MSLTLKRRDLQKCFSSIFGGGEKEPQRKKKRNSVSSETKFFFERSQELIWFFCSLLFDAKNKTANREQEKRKFLFLNFLPKIISILIFLHANEVRKNFYSSLKDNLWAPSHFLSSGTCITKKQFNIPPSIHPLSQFLWKWRHLPSGEALPSPVKKSDWRVIMKPATLNSRCQKTFYSTLNFFAVLIVLLEARSTTFSEFCCITCLVTPSSMSLYHHQAKPSVGLNLFSPLSRNDASSAPHVCLRVYFFRSPISLFLPYAFWELFFLSFFQWLIRRRYLFLSWSFVPFLSNLPVSL